MHVFRLPSSDRAALSRAVRDDSLTCGGYGQEREDPAVKQVIPWGFLISYFYWCFSIASFWGLNGNILSREWMCRSAFVVACKALVKAQPLVPRLPWASVAELEVSRGECIDIAPFPHTRMSSVGNKSVPLFGVYLGTLVTKSFASFCM